MCTCLSLAVVTLHQEFTGVLIHHQGCLTLQGYVCWMSGCVEIRAWPEKHSHGEFCRDLKISHLKLPQTIIRTFPFLGLGHFPLIHNFGGRRDIFPKRVLFLMFPWKEALLLADFPVASSTFGVCRLLFCRQVQRFAGSGWVDSPRQGVLMWWGMLDWDEQLPA